MAKALEDEKITEETLYQIQLALSEGLESLQKNPLLSKGAKRALGGAVPKPRSHKLFKKLRWLLNDSLGEDSNKLNKIYTLLNRDSESIARSLKLRQLGEKILTTMEVRNERKAMLREARKGIEYWEGRLDRISKIMNIKFHTPIKKDDLAHEDVDAARTSLTLRFQPASIREAIRSKVPLLQRFGDVAHWGYRTLRTHILAADNDNPPPDLPAVYTEFERMAQMDEGSYAHLKPELIADFINDNDQRLLDYG